jgi:microsomal epoxide hydrolase
VIGAVIGGAARHEVPQNTLDDLRERLVHTRWPDAIPEEGWERGTNVA